MIKKIPTANMSHEEWLAARQNGIGGSDAGAILGLNKYKSAYALWAEKCGLTKAPDLSDNEAVRVGTDLEQYVADRFCEATGKKVRKNNFMLQNTDYPFALANIDRAVVGEDAGLECKTTSSWEVIQNCQKGEYPDTYYCQCVHYMMVTGASKWYLAMLCLGKGFYWFEIARRENEIESLAAAEQDFWNRVISNNPPYADGSESTDIAIKTIFSESRDDGSVDLSPIRAQLLNRSYYDRQLKEIERMRDEADQQIMLYMADHSKGSCDGFTVSWKTQQRKTFDKKKALQKHPDLDSPEYYSVSSSRPFKVTVKE